MFYLINEIVSELEMIEIKIDDEDKALPFLCIHETNIDVHER